MRALLYLICICLSHGSFQQKLFHEVEFSSNVDDSGDILGGDSFVIYEISLYANNEKLSIEPVISGLHNPDALTDDSYSRGTYPTNPSFSVSFSGKLMAIDYIRVLSNCGDKKPSTFCKNSMLRFNDSIGRIRYQHVLLRSDHHMIKLMEYESVCRSNLLILDRAASVDEYCEWECEECLNYIYIDTENQTLTTSPGDGATSNCQCPEFKYDVWENDHYLKIFDNDGHYVGSMTRGGNLQHVHLGWTHWLGIEQSCKQRYLPNIEDLLTIPSYHALSLEFTVDNLYERLCVDEEDVCQFQREALALNFSDSLNDLFNESWVLRCELNENVVTESEYSYTLKVRSFGQKDTLSVLNLLDIYNSSKALIHQNIETKLEDMYGVNISFIDGITSSYDIVVSENDTCHFYSKLEPYDPIPGHKSNALGIAFIIYILLGCCCCCSAVILLICYKKKGLKGRFSVKRWRKTKLKKVDSFVSKSPSERRRALKTTDSNHHSIPSDSAFGFPAAQIPGYEDYMRGITIPQGAHIPTGFSGAMENSAADLIKQGTQHVSSGPTGPSADDLIKQGTRHVPRRGWDYGSQMNLNSGEYGMVPMIEMDDDEGDDGAFNEQPVSEPGASVRRENTEQSSFCESDDEEMKQLLDRASKSGRVTHIPKGELYERIALLHIIGEGSFGQVWKAKWRPRRLAMNNSARSQSRSQSSAVSDHSMEFIAVKLFSGQNVSSIPSMNGYKSRTATSFGQHLSPSPNTTSPHGVPSLDSQKSSMSSEQRKELYAEIALATSMPPHANVVRIHAFCQEPPCIVMEYMTGGSVMNLVYGLSDKPVPGIPEKLLILIKACSGLKHLTRNGLHHRDIAARNILMGHYVDNIDESTLVKITDFGMTRNEKTGKSAQKTKSDDGPYKWMAPESIQRKEYNEKTDVYMFGITMWEIMYGQEPYEHLDPINAAMNVCMKDERPDFLWDLPPGLKTLIKKCWDKDPEQRPTFDNVCKRLVRMRDRLLDDIKEMKDFEDALEEDHMKQEKAAKAYASYDPESE